MKLLFFYVIISSYLLLKQSLRTKATQQKQGFISPGALLTVWRKLFRRGGKKGKKKTKNFLLTSLLWQPQRLPDNLDSSIYDVTLSCNSEECYFYYPGLGLNRAVKQTPLLSFQPCDLLKSEQKGYQKLLKGCKDGNSQCPTSFPTWRPMCLRES